MKIAKNSPHDADTDIDTGNGLKKEDPLPLSVRRILKQIGENPQREGLLKTPQRHARALRFLTSGYRQDPTQVLKNALFTENYSEMVVLRDIEMFSLCEHHLLPFFGKAHIAYIPRGKIVGLSKIPRVVDIFAHRLQVQERLTEEIANTIYKVLRPHGVGVIIEARHLCMMMRGVEKLNSKATTSCMLGTFRKDTKTRQEFLSLVRRS